MPKACPHRQAYYGILFPFHVFFDAPVISSLFSTQNKGAADFSAAPFSHILK